MEYPEDDRFLDLWDQYMYGPDLLVAPVWRSGQRSREVALPEGEWEWYWDRSRRYSGPSSVSVESALDTLPLFVRRGSAL
jgi:alpha-glucosidase (family GH31 glycosyl hydrolase)